MNTTTKTSFVIGTLIIIIVVLLIIGNRQTTTEIVSETGTEIPCLPNGHQQVASHIHPDLVIFTDGEPEVIPGNIGITATCMREVHTHDAAGRIHVETAEPGVVYTLADFYTVWDENIERPGYNVQFIKDAEEVSSAEELVLEDGSEIVVVYTSVE